MGSSGSGKSTIGEALSTRLNAAFIEGDSLHTATNKAKMSSGVALTDHDRWPWLKHLGTTLGMREGRVVASCSALRKAYRQCISEYAREPVLFVYLHGTRATLAARLSTREGHFMSATLLDSQLSTLEIPDEHEFAITVNVDQPVDKIVDTIANVLQH